MFSSAKSNTVYKTVNIKNLDINDYKERIENYKNTINLFKDLNGSKCLVSSKQKSGTTNSISNQRSYYIDNTQIYLKNRIGNNSRYGTVFFSIFNNKNFAVKLSPVSRYNIQEVKLIQKLSKITEEDKNPHFLLNYKLFICNNKFKVKNLPTVIAKGDYFININELVNGTFKDFLKFTTSVLLLNALQQILLCVLSFHHFTDGLFHNDCHLKNFLFLKIKPGGYFHYRIFNKDIYIKNLGYIWFIWDFGLVKIKEAYKNRRLEDYFRILPFFLRYENYNSNSSNTVPIKIVSSILKYRKIHSALFGNSDKLFFEQLFKISKLFNYSIPSTEVTINKNPYIIE